MATLEELSVQIRNLHRDIRKIRQILEDPTGEKAKSRAENNGFKKPIKIDASLASFLGVGPDQLVSRSHVTKAVNKYAEEHKLKAGQTIHMDAKLKALLNPPDGETVTFLKLQKYLAPHYIKESNVPAPPPSVADPPKKPRVKKN